MSGARFHRATVEQLRSSLSRRDLAVLDQVRDLKLMSGAQIQSIHFPMLDHATADAAGRACRRVLGRLVRDGLVIRLDRRIGGIRGGSAGFIYAASELGHRLLDADGPRRRFKEPSRTFVTHTLAIAQLVVALTDGHATKTFEILRLEPEPRCWRSFTSTSGTQLVRPDLFVALGVGEYEHHWFVEIDLGTETMPRRIVKCKQYEAYYRSGQEQTAHDLFPKILWCMPNSALATELRERIHRTPGLPDELFVVTPRSDALAVLTGGSS